jgi:hypothetical protein
MLVAACAKRDRIDNGGYTPLARAIENNHPHVAEYLVHSGAKMSNVERSVKLPAWMNDVIAKRGNAVASLLVLCGILRRRFKVPCLATAHIGNHIPRDIVNLISIYVWSSRLDPGWLRVPKRSKTCLLC